MSATSEQIDARWIKDFRRRIKPWYQKSGRDLPWRSTRDPYRIWISEIMLQQTQVSTVIPYYERFLKRFADVRSLAKADESEVLRFWEGLGYYRRARQLHAAAGQIVERHDGVFPHDFDDVLSLPGVGRYTAGAILSFSLDQRLPIVEANTIRLYARLIGMTESVDERSSQNALWAFAESVLPRSSCGNFNQALIELGSTVCQPRNPLCKQCPVATQCIARIAGIEQNLPRKKPRQKFRDVEESVLVIRRSGKLLMRICGEDEWWTGLWDFPRYRLPAGDSSKLQTLCFDQTGLRIEIDQPTFSLRHTVTHHRIALDCYVATKTRGRLKSNSLNSVSGDLKSRTGQASQKTPVQRTGEGLQWISSEQLAKLPLSVTGRKVVQRLNL